MCPYAIHDKPNPPLITCGPLNKLCTMCFMGNWNQYNECVRLEKPVYIRLRRGNEKVSIIDKVVGV